MIIVFTDFKVKLEDKDGNILIDWKPVAGSSEEFCDLTRLNLQAYSMYTVSVRAVNYAGYISDPVSTHVFIEVTKPVFTGKYKCFISKFECYAIFLESTWSKYFCLNWSKETVIDNILYHYW